MVKLFSITLLSKNSDVGTHTYTVEELQRNNPNITYDSMKANVKFLLQKKDIF